MKCLLCSDKSFEKKSVKSNKKLVSARDQFKRDGLICSTCNRLACKECVSSFLKKAGGHGKKDPWCVVVKKYLEDGKQPADFVGHCCELGVDTEISSKSKKMKSESWGTKYDGWLHLPQFRVMVEPGFECVDVHGLVECAEAMASVKEDAEGKEDSCNIPKYHIHFGPVAHCVIGEEASKRYYKNNVVSKGDGGNYLGVYTIEVGSVEDSCKRQELKVNVIAFDCIDKEKPKMVRGRHVIDKNLKGSNSPSDVTVEECSLVDTNFMVRENNELVDGTIVVGQYSWTDHQSLLCFRWTKKEYVMRLKKKEIKDLYEMVMAGIPRNGWEPRRSGGSCGKTKKDDDLKQFVSVPCALPRQGSGCKFIQLEHAWMVIYMSTVYSKKRHGRLDERGLEEEWDWDDFGVSKTSYALLERDEMKVAMVRYSQPVRGGARNIHFCDLEAQPCLYNFAEAKAMAAMVLNELNKIDGFKVHVFAVRHELFSLDRARRYSELMLDKSLSSREAVLSNYIGENKHTLVQHSVGYHFDYLHRNEPGLENKQLFKCNLFKSKYGMGRGGAGADNFVFAILDWRHTQSGLRRQIYLQNGGAAQSLNQRDWDEFTARRPALRQELNARIGEQDAQIAARAAARNNNV